MISDVRFLVRSLKDFLNADGGHGFSTRYGECHSGISNKWRGIFFIIVRSRINREVLIFGCFFLCQQCEKFKLENYARTW